MTRGPERSAEDAARPEEGFLQRWSRRKREVRVESLHDASPPQAAAPAPEAGEPAAAPLVDVTPPSTAPAPGDADMPALESLGAGSDVSAFFSPRVSESLRRAALRRIFRQPEYNVSDGLDPYLTDFRNLKPLGNVVTADMRLGLERARERLAKLGESSPAQATATPAPAADTPDAPAPDATDSTGEDHDDA